MTFGEMLKEERKAAGLTLKELGDNIGTSKSYLSSIETGVFPPPPPEMIAKIAQALGKDEKTLQIKAYVERAPKVIKKTVETALSRKKAGRAKA